MQLLFRLDTVQRLLTQSIRVASPTVACLTELYEKLHTAGRKAVNTEAFAEFMWGKFGYERYRTDDAVHFYNSLLHVLANDMSIN